MAKLTDLETINSGEVRSQDGLYLIHKDEPTEEVPNPEYEDRRININKLAAALPYDATESGLTATTLQTAIDEVVGMAPDALGDIGDVTITSPQNNQLLRYNGTTSKWENVKYVEGSSNTATGTDAHAEGVYTVASGVGSHSEGLGTLNQPGETDKQLVASGDGSHAEGKTTTASGFAAHAEGSFSIASGEDSHAEGASTIASGMSSHAEGGYTQANGQCSHVEGQYTQTGETSGPAHAEGQNTQAIGISSHAEGYYTTAPGNYSHSGGHGSLSYGDNSFAHGCTYAGLSFAFKLFIDFSNIADREDSTKFYFDTAHAFSGTFDVKISNPDERLTNIYFAGDLSGGFSVKDQTTDQSVGGTGYNITGPLVFSKANNYTISATITTTFTFPANSYLAKADTTLARGTGYSGLSGAELVANGHNSFALGGGVVALGSCQTVLGSLNTPDATKALIIGNGTVDFSNTEPTCVRSNAMTVDWDGNIVANNIPAPPAADGTYTLQCTVSSGVATYAWV